MPESQEFDHHFIAIGQHGKAIIGKTSGPSPIPGEDTIARVRMTLQARRATRFAFLPGGMGDDGWFDVPTEYVGPLPEPRLLDCGFCYEEQGEEVHPHPECLAGRIDRSDRTALDALRLIFTRWKNAGHVPSSPAELLELVERVRAVAGSDATDSATAVSLRATRREPGPDDSDMVRAYINGWNAGREQAADDIGGPVVGTARIALDVQPGATTNGKEVGE